MKIVNSRFILGLGILLAIPFVCLHAAAQPANVGHVDVRDTVIRMQLPDIGASIEVVATPCYVQDRDADEAGVSAWEGRGRGQIIEVPRFGEGGRDRMFDRFVLLDADTRRVLGRGTYATGFDALTTSGTAKDWPANIKGIQDPLIYEDMPLLGVGHITDNVSLIHLIEGPAAKGDADELTYTVDGKRYRFSAEYVAKLDERYLYMLEYDINVIAIILVDLSDMEKEQYRDNPLVHRNAYPENMVVPLTAVNLAQAEGERRYRAALGFLARRYSREDNKYGRLGGYVISNEVNSHWIWHHMGALPPAAVVAQYAKQVRLSYYAVRQHNPDPRVFISMDHFWAANHGNDPTHAMPGRELLDRFAVEMQAQGDLPWNIAHHPYPENLFDPAFWEDETAWLAYDSPRITYKNAELLLGYLDRDEMKYQGERRRVIFSEQGFHAGTTPESEQVQAAAYALAHVKFSQIEEIDAHVLHRHTDHPDEGGLLLGVRACDEEGNPTRKRLMFDVFAAAGTDRQEEAFKFALPIIGIESWNAVTPSRGPFPDQLPGE